MKIAIISPGLLPVPPVSGGSVETVISKMAETSAAKFDVDIFSRGHYGLPADSKDGLLGHVRVQPGSEYFKEIRNLLNQGNYDLIQVENRPLFIPRTKKFNPQAKFICSLHSLIHIKENLIKPVFTEKIFENCEFVLVYSKFVRDRLAEKFPSLTERFRYIHLGADPDIFKFKWDPHSQKISALLKKQLSIPDNYKVILFSGRVIRKKGVHILIETMKQVVKVFPKCCLVIVGSQWFGSNASSPYLLKLKELSRGIEDRIRFTGYVEPDDLPKYFAMADLLICPSQWDEPFGLVNAEAMACGVPVVASDRGGIPEIISDGFNGFLVQNEKEPASFIKPVLRLLNNQEMAYRMGMWGRTMVESYFNWKRAGSEIISLYEEIFSKNLFSH